ncbi:hypothetical protein BDK51DRAFT_33470 [Blyttiomyces helicus]|uniref:Uncharacterized protein n=1 Tax=Blyttiomyces helicus TaxID=388810 RepID=A0A4P9VWH0_9FUNG|nr:hypothetical protein BDK51DRAFT_33470 [Blyttiomyces helicus]|eukprot:RKO83512.1 hypothetical protein BDK51DRAFT_33470 [Blyttiomyces helicus]
MSHDIEQRLCSLEQTVKIGATGTYNHNINIRDIDQRLRSLEKTTDSGANRTHKHIRNVNDTLHTTIHRNVNALNLRVDALYSFRINDQQRIDLLEKSLRHLRRQNAAMNNIIDNLHMDNAKYASFNAIVSDLYALPPGVSASRIYFIDNDNNMQHIKSHLRRHAYYLPKEGNAHTIQSSMLTSERPSSSSPCPDLLNLQGKRWVCGSEPEKNNTINGGFVKFLTGNDKISGRYCHQNSEVNFYPQHSLVIQCNAIPSLDGEDDAIWDRGRIIDFIYKFVDEPVGDFQRKIDRGLKEKVKTWGPQFMLILLEWYRIFQSEGLKPSTSVLLKTKEVRKDNDELLDFFETNFQLTDNRDDFILCKSVAELFKRKQVKNTFTRPKLREAALRFGAVVDKNCGRTKTSSGQWGYRYLTERTDIFFIIKGIVPQRFKFLLMETYVDETSGDEAEA